MNAVKEKIQELKVRKNAIILAHFYQESEVQDLADFVGDSLDLSKKTANTNADIIDSIPAPPLDSTCGCSDCKYMKLCTLEKISRCLETEENEIRLDPSTIEKAGIPIRKMLQLT